MIGTKTRSRHSICAEPAVCALVLALACLASVALGEASAGGSDAKQRRRLETIAAIDRLLAEGRERDADSIATALGLELDRSPRPGVADRIATLDSLVATFVRRTYPTLALHYSTRLLAEAETPGATSDADHARFLRRQARLLSGSDWVMSRRLAERALAMSRRSGTMSPEDHADYLEDLAGYLRGPGEADSCRAVLEECLAIREARFGPMSYPVARAYAGLASVDRGVGDYAGGVVHIERAIEIAERVLPRDDARLFPLYNSYGALVGTLRDDERCNRIFRRCVRLAEINFGLYHLDVARAMNNVGLNEYYLGRYETARDYHDSALVIRTRIGDEGGVHESLRNLGLVAWKQGRVDEAVGLLERCLVWDAGGLVNVSAAEVAAFLFQIHLERGEVSRADSCLAFELRIKDRFQLPEHPGRIEARYREALLARAQGDAHRAFALALDAAEHEREHFAISARTLPERMLLDYAESRPPAIDLALSLPDTTLAHEDLARLWDSIMRQRGRVLEEMARRRRAAVHATDPEARELLRRWTRAASNLGAAIARGTPGDSVSEARVASARAEVDRLESDVAERQLPLRAEHAWRQLGYADVRAALPADAALVSFVIHRDILVTGNPQGPSATAHYEALVLAGPQTMPELVHVGACARVDSLIDAWRDEVRRSPADPDARRRAGTALRKALWDPVAARVGGAESVYVVPDGAIALVNFDALPLDDRRYLLEDGRARTILATERDLVPRERGDVGEGLLVVAAPDFEAARVVPAHGRVEAELVADAEPAMWRGPPSGCPTPAGVRFDPLPWSGIEGEEVVAQWGGRDGRARASILTGAAAQESEFKRVAPGHRMLHLATHGFIFEGECSASASAFGGAATSGSNSLRLTGLAFAGANRPAGTDSVADDGMLTAEEIATLDLGTVDWVVLSACNTGVGNVRAGEGVFGLRRAFSIGGARNTVLSLWPVGDLAARQWVAAFYAARSEGARTAGEAVRRASRAMLERLRRRGADPNPAIWGAFVATETRTVEPSSRGSSTGLGGER